jgi:hypothetical protein
VEYLTIFQFTFKKCRNGEMKNLSVFILARKILFCSMIFPHSHKRTCPSTLNAPVRLVYGYRREGEGSRGSWKLYMLKKGSGIFVAEEKGVFPPINYCTHLIREKRVIMY